MSKRRSRFASIAFTNHLPIQGSKPFGAEPVISTTEIKNKNPFTWRVLMLEVMFILEQKVGYMSL